VNPHVGKSVQVAAAKPLAERGTKEASADALSGPLPAETAESRIRTLAWSERSPAAVELAEFSLSPDVTRRAKTLLLAVRALARKADHPAAERALLQHLRTKPNGDEPTLRSLARATAAFALAAEGPIDGVRNLVLLAAGPDDADEEVKIFAREALIAHPPSAAELAKALPWLDARAREGKVAWLSSRASVRNERRAARCKEARKALSSLGALPTGAAAARLADLAVCPEDAGPTMDDWKRLAHSSSLWALRGTAALGVGTRDGDWTRFAEAELAQGDARVRSAAAWFLATSSPEAAARLLVDERAEVRSAARNQRDGGGIGAGMAAGHPCAEQDEDSTKEVFERFVASPPRDTGPALGCLASRLRAAAGPGLTAAELESWFRGGPAVTRVLVARGLAASSAEARFLALGLSARLYRAEADAYVRRFLCAALLTLGQDLEEPLGVEMADLDPDPVCRALAGGRSWPPLGSPTLATVTTAKRYLAARVLGSPVWLEAAPDGFVGARVLDVEPSQVVDPRFVDCSESGEPSWACGPTALRPR
jgi:hypothetical protein